MPRRRWSLNTVYISERLRECLRPLSQCALTTVVAPMGYGKTTAVNWYLGEQSRDRGAADYPYQRVFRQSRNLLEKRSGRL